MLNNRWGILTVLFIVRATMAVQFSSLGAVAPLLSSELGFSIADVGILIGLYHAPGIALALPGGAFGQRFGDKATVLGALALMLAGGVLMALAPSWPLQITGRLVAGAGAAMMSVVLTKMLTDWFAGNRDRNGDLYQFLAGWHRAVAAAAAAARHTPWRQRCASRRSRLHRQLHAAARYLLPRATGYCAVPTCKSAPRPWCRRGARHDGLIWGFFNIGFAMIFSFGPSMLVEHGWSIAAAGSTISIVLWISAVTVPLGGFLADRFRRPQQIIVVSCVAFGALLLVLPRSGAVIATVMALGAISGLPAGPIMSLPAKVLQPGTRAIGMGLFFTVFYVCMMLGPAAAGAIGKWAGSAASALDFGAAMILACPLLLWLGNRIPQFTTKPA